MERIVIPTAGRGTRLAPATLNQPKEMLPLFSSTPQGALCVKPILQMIFEQASDFGLRSFCFIVGRGKRSIEDHFTPSQEQILSIGSSAGREIAQDLSAFYARLKKCTINWTNQPEPLGFGDAVSRAEAFVGRDPFLVHAGDTLVSSQGLTHLTRLIDAFEHEKADAAFLTQTVEDPRRFGVVVGSPHAPDRYLVRKVIEKPSWPPSRVGIVPVYVFSPSIFGALAEVRPDRSGEIQLTDGIQRMVESESRVIAVQMTDHEIRLDVGTPESYWEAIQYSYLIATNQIHRALEKQSVRKRRKRNARSDRDEWASRHPII